MNLPKIAICITTFNRPEILYRGFEEQLKYLPDDSMIFIYEDGSADKADLDKLKSIADRVGMGMRCVYEYAEENKGIATAKNKCLEWADEMKSEHIFLFDSDTWPRKVGWEKPYIESKEPHLMYIFTEFATDDENGHNLSDCHEIYRDSSIVAFDHVRGCMLYVDQRVLETVGGFDQRYGKAMFEHTDYSNRIHNAGLTTFRVMDVPGSHDLIYSMDEYREASSSISAYERKAGLMNNRALHAESLTSRAYCEYTFKHGSRDIVLTNFYTSGPDFQRNNQHWKPDIIDIIPLKNSVEDRGAEFVLLHDCFEDYAEFAENKVECTMDVYFNRIFRSYEYLRDHPEVRRVFVTDATDVTMLNNPFSHMEPGKIYIGEEPLLLGCRWIREKAQREPFRSFVMNNLKYRLLNVGLIGGSREDVMMLLHDMMTLYADAGMVGNDMVFVNYLMRTKYADKLAHGTGLVNNVFKSMQPTPARTEWFLHK